MPLLFALLTALVFAATPPTTHTSSASHGTAAHSTVPKGLAYPAPVVLTAEDGTTLQASVGVPANATSGVVFVHMAGHSKEEWDAVASKFYLVGLAVLTVDLRGHGANVGASAPTLTGADWLAMVQDVRAGVAELHKRGAVRVALVGAELGGNLAINEAASDPTIASVAMLSPGLDYKGVASGEAVKRYGARPLFLVASQDDAYSARSASALASVATGIHTVQLFDAAGKGTKMLNHEPTLESLLLGFVNTSWTAPAAPTVAGTVNTSVKTEQMQTSGPRIGEGTPAPAPK